MRDHAYLLMTRLPLVLSFYCLVAWVLCEWRAKHEDLPAEKAAAFSRWGGILLGIAILLLLLWTALRPSIQ
jgi:hypothetical protein